MQQTYLLTRKNNDEERTVRHCLQNHASTITTIYLLICNEERNSSNRNFVNMGNMFTPIEKASPL